MFFMAIFCSSYYTLGLEQILTIVHNQKGDQQVEGSDYLPLVPYGETLPAIVHLATGPQCKKDLDLLE